jgi:uncharacterized protein (TIGR00369 family)
MLSPIDPISLQNFQRAYANSFNESLTLRFFGARVEFPTVDRVRVVLPVKPDHRGGLGSEAVNGGIIASIFDLTISCTSALVDPRRRSATIQLSMNFERGLRGAVVVGDGWIDRAGGTTMFSSAEIKDESGQVCARCQGILRMSESHWENGVSPSIN